MIIGFTGTQKGMTARQFYWLSKTLIKLASSETLTKAHHGDCIGADDEFHFLLCLDEAFMWKNVIIEIHPSTIESKRAFNKADIIHDPKAPLERNKNIVDASDLLIATPKEKEEVLRSGTWSTIRHVRKLKKEIIIIYPDGSLGE